LSGSQPCPWALQYYTALDARLQSIFNLMMCALDSFKQGHIWGSHRVRIHWQGNSDSELIHARRPI
jgi:hypothetical protein